MTIEVDRPAPPRPGPGRPWPSPRRIGAALVGARMVLAIATALIGSTLWWCLRQPYNVILSYADAPTHLNLARRVHDDLHPGLGQLGAYWLPLAHVIELPFVWNDALWHSGLAGAIPSMGCYLLSVWLIYQLAFLATAQRIPGAIAALAFAANPNVLYLHVLPMFEPSIIASVLAATYLLALWLRRRKLWLLVAAAAAVSVMCTSRYEAWAAAVAAGGVVLVALWRQGETRDRVVGRLVLFLLLAWYGMALWLLWNLALNGDPLYFLHPSFNKGLAEDRLAILTKHHLTHAVAYVYFSVYDNAGRILVALGVLGLLRFVAQLVRWTEGLWLVLLAAPALFDAFYLWFKGTPPILVPDLIPFISGNIRYGVVSLPLLCVLAGCLARRPIAAARMSADDAVPPDSVESSVTVTTVTTTTSATSATTVTTVTAGAADATGAVGAAHGVTRDATRALAALPALLRPVWPLVQLGLLALVVAQPLMLLRRGDVVSYNEANNAAYRAAQQVRTDVAHWLGAHYTGGLILMSTFKGADRIILDSGLPDDVFVHEGSQETWRCALRYPQRWARWVVLFKRGDGAATLLKSRTVSQQLYFTRVRDAAGSSYYLVYRRNTRPWPPKGYVRRSPCA